MGLLSDWLVGGFGYYQWKKNDYALMHTMFV